MHFIKVKSTECTCNSGMPDHVTCVAEVSDRLSLKVLTPKQMLQRLSKALAQEKVGNTSEMY